MAGAIRRAVVKQQPITRVRSTVVPDYHAHQCLQCRQRYADRCGDGRKNGRCMSCTHGHEVSVERRDRMPKDCCRAHSKVITDPDVLRKYALGGEGSWWQCTGVHGCFRTHPFDPQESA